MRAVPAAGLGKRFGSHRAVDNLSFHVRPGVISGDAPSPSIGLLIFVIFLAIVLGIAWALFERRDAQKR